MSQWDVIIIGAGAAGLMCAIEAGKRGRHVLVLDHSNKAGKKILMSGGGRCNFTNYDVSATHYLSNNPHFAKSALSRFTQWDFLALVNKHNIAFHERDHGQLFCDDSAKDIVNMLLKECADANVSIELNTQINKVSKVNADTSHFSVKTANKDFQAVSLVIATGGLSIPKMCATPLGYKIAAQFGLPVTPTHAGLVPFTWQEQDKLRYDTLSGIAIPAAVTVNSTTFRENVLFTHRGLSGPAILQISSFWATGQPVQIDWLPGQNVEHLIAASTPQTKVKNILSNCLPNRVIETLWSEFPVNQPAQHWRKAQITELANAIHQWSFQPNGTEGYRTAEVTVGGVDCNALSSKTMQARDVPGLFFIGELVDITGWLGGYNFQWAWSSGWCAGQVV